MAVTREPLWRDINGKPGQLIVGRKQTVIYTVLTGGRTIVDLTGKTLAVAAKAVDMVTPEAIAATIAAVSGQETAGKAAIVFPAAELTAARVGTVEVDVILESEICGLREAELEASDAD